MKSLRSQRSPQFSIRKVRTEAALPFFEADPQRRRNRPVRETHAIWLSPHLGVRVSPGGRTKNLGPSLPTVSTLSWQDGGLMFVAVADVPTADLAQLRDAFNR